MTTKRLISICLVTALALATWTEARAGVALNQLKGGVVNHMEDQDFETLIDNAGDPTELDPGDYLVGMFTISTFKAPPNATSINLQGGSTYTGVFVIEVDTVGTGGLGSTFTFKPAPDSAWTDLGLVRTDSDTMIRIYEDNGGFPNVSDSLVGQNSLGLAGALDTAEDGTALWEFGFAGGADEFWSATADSTDVTLVTALTFANGLNVTANLIGIDLDKHNFKGFAGPTQLQTTGSLENIFPVVLDADGNVVLDGAGDPIPSVLPVWTESDLYIKPHFVPEASSIVAWSLLGLIGGGLSFRRFGRRAGTA